jgi:chemotaxis protein MotB
MIQRLKFFWVLMLVSLLMSCVSEKKLDAVNEELNELRNKNIELTKREQTIYEEMMNLTSQNEALKQQFEAYKSECEAAQQALRQVNSILHAEAENMRRVKVKLQEALFDFNTRGVDVYTKQGLVYVSLSDGLLYKSGSALLDKNGKKALASLADVLNAYPDLKVIIVGNTDNVPSKTGRDNWTLSTERANSVVRVLRDEYKVDPARLTSGGKGKYNPVADNSTPDGRAKNRRTDIILNPNIEKIWENTRNDN